MIIDKPYKVIWKYKNENRYTQYNIYIYVGNVSAEIDEILQKIKNLNLYETFVNLNETEKNKLSKEYGDKWYEYFFNMYHIIFIFSQINNTESMKNEIIKKYGIEWYDTHIITSKGIEKKIIYSYDALIKTELERKTIKKGRAMNFGDENEKTNFKLSKNETINSILGRKDEFKKKIQRISNKSKKTDHNRRINRTNSNLYISEKQDNNTTDSNKLLSTEIDTNNNTKIMKSMFYNWETKKYILLNNVLGKSFNDGKMKGGGSDDEEDEEDEEEENDEEENDEEENDEEDNKDEENEDGEENEENEESEGKKEDVENKDDDIEKLYYTDDVLIDENIEKTNLMIRKTLNENVTNNKNEKMLDFDNKKDVSMTIEKLKFVYEKYYVKNQFILCDDTIKEIKNKICCSIKNNVKFGENSYIIPSRQYLWGEYVYNDEINKVMLGQKWVRRNELLDVDVEPDNRFHLYEHLKDNFTDLKNIIRKSGSRNKREDDENNILSEYENYITFNEIYMLDVYNEFGKNYNPTNEIKKNLEDLYLKIYFPNIRREDITHIIDYLNDKNDIEINRTKIVFENLYNDLILQNKIYDVISDVKKNDKYTHIFKENYVTHSVIHLNLRLTKSKKIDMYRVFNEFMTNKDFPYIQYQTLDSGSDYKYNIDEIYNYTQDDDNMKTLHKWFENGFYGLTFKIRLDKEANEPKNRNNFLSVLINEVGRLEYKINWQETEKATLDDIKKTYKYIKNLIVKINQDSPKNQSFVPDDDEFKFAFINTIQKFDLPEKFVIEHNNLRDFSRFFYPYISLIIDPKKRISKKSNENDKSKYGTYLRYKKISGYENLAKIEQRIMYFIKHYEYDESKLIEELAREFNITDEKATKEYMRVKLKYPNLKKSRKVLKKLDKIPKYKSSGINIDIQGKKRENYKIRISGARNKNQLYRIIDFMNVLIFLYSETYLYKKKERQILKEILTQLTDIAKSRAKVDEVVEYDELLSFNIKQKIKKDKHRIGYKPEKGQNQWSRNCQNSGDKKRQPQQYNSSSISDLLKDGYSYNKKTDTYERKYIEGKGKDKKEIILKALKLPEYDSKMEKTGNFVYYTCDPKENKNNYFVGILTRAKNPYGHCMPCCFKKNQDETKNKAKKEFYDKCFGNETEIKDTIEGEYKSVGDKLYILQDTNKIQEGRYGYLPKYMDLFFNILMDNKNKRRQHYLEQTDGYFFKYGPKISDYTFLNAIEPLINKNIEEIREAIIEAIEGDKSTQYFTSLNSGDIKTSFGTKDKYIKFIKESKFLEFEMVKDIICIPGVLHKQGLNLVVFKRIYSVVKKTLEKDKIIDDFNLECINEDSIYNIMNPKRPTIIIVKDNKTYYPIILVIKKNKNDKTVNTETMFYYEDKPSNIVKHILDFIMKNCGDNNLKMFNKLSFSASKIYHEIEKLEDPKLKIKQQVIDTRNKCKFLITNEGYLIPTRPSGTIWNISIIKNIDKYIVSFDETLKYLSQIKKSVDIDLYATGVYYDVIEDDKAKVITIITNTKENIPVKEEFIELSKLKKLNLLYIKKSLLSKIDIEIEKGSTNIKIDERIQQINENIFTEEAYQIFRLTFSNFITDSENITLRKKIDDIVMSKMTHKDKIHKVRLMIYKLIDPHLHEKYIEIANIKEDDFQVGGKYEKLIHKVSKIPNIIKYEPNNDRETCAIHENIDQCSRNPHCTWNRDKCYLALTTRMIVLFVNKIAEEIVYNDFKAFEIFKVGEYYVSDIVDRSRFSYIEGQKIIRASSSNIKKILGELFGRDNVPIIGKNIKSKTESKNYITLNLENPLMDLVDYYIQKIIPNNQTIFRAFSNGFYWNKNNYYSTESRNLGFYSPEQSNFATNFRSMCIDLLTDPNEVKNITPIIKSKLKLSNDVNDNESKNKINEFIYEISNNVSNFSNGYVELLILSLIYKDIVIRIYDYSNNIVEMIENGLVLDKNHKSKNTNMINIKYEYGSSTQVPENVYVIYYA